MSDRDSAEVFEAIRIYMESKGRPFNYLKTEAEVGEFGFIPQPKRPDLDEKGFIPSKEYELEGKLIKIRR